MIMSISVAVDVLRKPRHLKKTKISEKDKNSSKHSNNKESLIGHDDKYTLKKLQKGVNAHTRSSMFEYKRNTNQLVGVDTKFQI